jgi:branched-chain amino acid transport system substrate-binding protein
LNSKRVMPRMRLAGALAALVALLALSGCGGSGSSTAASTSAPATTAGSTGTSAGSSTAASTQTGTGTSTGATTSSGPVSVSSCGPKPGVKASGTPIALGTINTKQPGTDFTDQAEMAQAYFTCLNANGGINGHPVKYYIQTDQTQPAQIAAAAKQLIQTDHVLGIVGTSDLLECTIDKSYWKQIGVFELGAGIAPECWSTANSASVNMGPRYSSDGAVQYALDTIHAKKIVFVQSNVPGTGYIADGPAALAKAANTPITELTADVPINDANSLALKLVDDAGTNGSVILNFTPPEALVILQAAQKLGLEDRVKSWGCSTPCNTDFLAKALGPKWNHKLFVNAELTDPDDHNGPEMQLYKAVLAKYGKSVSGGVGSFSQMGFLTAEMAASALQKVTGAYTLQSVNAALKGIDGYKTEMLCQPFVFGNYSEHIPNNADYTVTPENGRMVTVQGCTPISANDPQIAAYRKLAG